MLTWLNGAATYIQISDFANACALEAQNMGVTNGQRLVLALAVNDASGQAAPPTAPGSFTVVANSAGPAGSNVADLYYEGGCMKAQAHGGRSGTGTLTRVSADGSLEGSFDIVLTCDGFSSCTGLDAHLTGTFRAAPCASLNVNRTPPCP